MSKDELALRAGIITQCRWMNDHGLNQGTSGNISARHGGTMLLTPSAIAYDAMTPEMICAMPIEGEYGVWEGTHIPSTEWRFHLDIMRARPEVNAIVHTHSTFATILAIGRHDIPACHYMIAAFGGHTVRCADYATFGTKELSANVLTALKGRSACLLANHGMIVTGSSLAKAMWAAVELETLAKQYYHAVVMGKPVILDEAEILRVKENMGNYGLQDGAPRQATLLKAPAKKAAAKPVKVTVR
jgi:L-fuculose-phosphate aldolase